MYRVKRKDGRGRLRTLHRNHLLPIGTIPILADDIDSEQDCFKSDSILNNETSVSMPPVRFPINSEALPVNSDNYHDIDTDSLRVEVADSTHSDFEAESDTRVENDVELEMVTDQCEEVNSALDSESSAVSIQSSSDSSEIGTNENLVVDSDVGQVGANSAETEVPTVAPPTPVPRPRRPQQDRRPPDRYKPEDFAIFSQQPTQNSLNTHDKENKTEFVAALAMHQSG